MRWNLLLTCVLAGACSLAGAADLQMQAEAAFVGLGSSHGVLPVSVTLSNRGADTRGALRVSCEGFQMDYPVELPHDSVKRLTIYPDVNYGSEVALDLSTTQGNLHRVFRQFANADSTAQTILYIGDGQGSLGFLLPRANETTSRMSAGYVKPELAPDRSIAYSNISAVVLGPGSERITDGVVRALHNYVSAGGTLAFFGGASAPTVIDRRWADIIPVSPGKPKNVRGSELIDNLSQTDRIRGGFTIFHCTPSPDAVVRREDGNTILAKRDIGLGKTVFMAFNPLEPPFTRWPGRRALFEKVLRPIDSSRAAGYLASFGQSDTDIRPGWSYSSSPYSSSYGGSSPYDTSRDPFSTKLPPSGKVLWILASYFVVIIPINFLVLKKLKRGELAWLTAPLISVAFAGIFFAAAKDLYSASLSTATQGLIVATSNGGDAIFVGKSQFFFPRGGEYDLKMDGLQQVGSVSADEPYYYRSRSDNGLEDVNPIDIGHVLVSRMDVHNLAFRELAYTQFVPEQRWLSVSLVGKQLKIVNTGAYTLTAITALVAGKSFPLPTALAPGETTTVELPQIIQPDQSPDQEQQPSYGYSGRNTLHYNGLSDLTATTKGIVVKATIATPPVGPGIGNPVAAREDVTLAFFTDFHYGKVQL